jgi:uncharacterized membrane protein YidH (DUF202 family)
MDTSIAWLRTMLWLVAIACTLHSIQNAARVDELTKVGGAGTNSCGLSQRFPRLVWFSEA